MGDGQKVYVVGLDTEFISRDNYPVSFDKSNQWVTDNSCKVAICIIQIASKSVCLVINLVKMGKPMPKKLIKLLTSESWIKLGVGIDNDMRLISSNYRLGHCSGSMELKSFALITGHPTPNLELLYNQLIGGHVKKTDSVHDWTKELTDEQISYAAKDAIMSYQLGISILNPSLSNIKDLINKNKSDKLDFVIGNDNIKPTKIERSLDTKINYIGKLNEYAQQLKLNSPEYASVADNTKHPIKFTVICTFNDKKTDATGLSKQEAKSIAAKLMLEQIN
jgi:hypothetical protein